MNRLPVPDVFIVSILEFLKSNNEKTYTARQITQHFWDNYTYPQSKTWKQLNAETNAQIAIHKNKEGRYTQAYPLQITEYQTIPYTYQYKDVTENTAIEKNNPKQIVEKASSLKNAQMSFEGLMDDAINQASEASEAVEQSVEESTEESVLLEDVKACEKVMEIHNYKSSLIHWLTTSKDKQETLVEILKTIAEHA
jgi:hypothetical protein